MEKYNEQGSNIVLQNKYGLDIFRGKFCLVGESYGFGSDAVIDFCKCEKCNNLAHGHTKIDNITYFEAIHNLKNFYTFKQGLYNHLMEAHPEKLLRKGV